MEKTSFAKGLETVEFRSVSECNRGPSLCLRTFILKSLVFGEKAGPCGPGGAGTMHDEHHHHTQKSVRGLEPVKKETTLACRESIQIQNCIEHLKFTTECVLQDMNITIGECHNRGTATPKAVPVGTGVDANGIYNYYDGF